MGEDDIYQPDRLFPECCYRCEYREPVTGSCGRDDDQLLREFFTEDPDRPCPRYSPDE